ncbi:MAG TPA: CsbD family protein [Terriglobia bacterium]|nr:CsbD family protein [Terriglobia bacterium]
MNWTRVERKWNQVKGPAKTNWAKLTDKDLDQVAGRKDKLIDLLQERYGIARVEAVKEVDTWIRVMHARLRDRGWSPQVSADGR